MATKRVYFFGRGKAEGHGKMKDILGGKGAGLAEMTNLGVPVPPGFTISTEICNLYYRNRGKIPADVNREIAAHLARLERVTGKKFGDPKNPLLVSVRSGAKFSMPGMMDTILNLGLNDKTVQGLGKKTKNERFACDSYRRFLMMFSDVVLGIDKENFEHLFDQKKKRARRGQRPRHDGRGPQGRLREVQEPRQGANPERVSPGSPGAARACPGRRIQILEQ